MSDLVQSRSCDAGGPRSSGLATGWLVNGLGTRGFATGLAPCRRHLLGVVAWVDGQLAVVQIGDVGADTILKMAVVRTVDHGAVAGGQHLFEQRIVLMSRLLVGSSISRVSGSAAGASASSTRSCQPCARALMGPACCSSGMSGPNSRSPAQASAGKPQLGEAHVPGAPYPSPLPH